MVWKNYIFSLDEKIRLFSVTISHKKTWYFVLLFLVYFFSFTKLYFRSTKKKETNIKIFSTECFIDLGKLNLLKISLPWPKSEKLTVGSHDCNYCRYFNSIILINFRKYGKYLNKGWLFLTNAYSYVKLNSVYKIKFGLVAYTITWYLMTHLGSTSMKLCLD